jgi:S-formylglutathione hydrolase FrmB
MFANISRPRATLLVPLILLAALNTFAQRPASRANAAVLSSAPTVETVQFQSKLVNATLPYNAILPPDYNEARATRYPVLYLLHGITGHYSDWLTHTNLADYAADYRMIIVIPEGNNGWYTDSATVVNDKYESYILKDLIPDVQKRYRTIEARFGRAIAGLSMGGYGALKFGLKNPETFAFAASLSGVVPAASLTEEDLKGMGATIHDSVFAVFGPAGSETRKKNDILEMVRGLSAGRLASLPYFYVDCGTEDFLIIPNQQFAALLTAKKVPHEYRELPGNHNWAYWDQQVQEVVRLAAQHVRTPRVRKPR